MSQPTEFVLVPKVALDWLNGSAPDANGHWFGDAPDDNPKGHAFWWRTKFSAMIAASPSIPEGEVGEIDPCEERIAELEAAIDSAEVAHGLTADGSLWRFWSQKAQAVAERNVALSAEIERLKDQVLKAVIQVGEQARMRGEAEGKLHVSELAGIVEGWQRRAEAAEASLLTLQQERDRLKEEVKEAEARGIERAAKVIEEGFDRAGIATKSDKCTHGLYGWEDCEQCAVLAIRQLLEKQG